MRALIISCLAFMPLVCNAQFAVVVHPDSGIEKLSGEQVASIFLGKTNRFPNGALAQPMEVNNVELREHFYESISGKSLSQLRSYWATLVFTGKGRPPQVLGDVDQIVQQFPGERGLITYVPQDQITASMKVVYAAP